MRAYTVNQNNKFIRLFISINYNQNNTERVIYLNSENKFFLYIWKKTQLSSWTVSQKL